jgi:adenosylhomocysteinase
MASVIVDASLAPEGRRKIKWASTWAPVMTMVRDQLIREGSVRARRIGIILPIEPKTAYLAAILAEAGAHVSLACPAALTSDEVAAGLADLGVEVFARSDSTRDEERRHYEQVLSRRPEVVIDDRAELIRMAHSTHRDALDDLKGASEETTSGVVALRAMERDGSLKIPCIAANDARCKYLFDNRYGSGQSTVTAVMDSTNLLVAGKVVLVVGYGWVGKGIARRLRGMGARVEVSEVDAFAALEAYHDGFEVAPKEEACGRADIVMTATGCRGALGERELSCLRDGTVLANTGGIDDEIDMEWLRREAVQQREVRKKVVEFRLTGRRSVYVIGDGRVVNLSAGEGHPVEIMDLTFAVQALAAVHLLLHAHEMKAGVHLLPGEIDERIARNKLAALGVGIDELSPEQDRFLSSWEVPL